MASSAVFLFPIPPPPTPSNSPPSLLCSVPPLVTIFNKTHTTRTASCRPLLVSASASASSHSLQALIFDCDGVILESEHLHRQAYNDAFQHFSVRCPSSSSPLPLNWSPEFYDELQNFIGGGKPKMRWYFKENGWPTSTVFNTPPEKDEDRAKLIDILQDWKTERYKKILKSGTGKLLAVCSAATKSSVILCLENLIGMERFQNLDCFLAEMKRYKTVCDTRETRRRRADRPPVVYSQQARILSFWTHTGSLVFCFSFLLVGPVG
ncbi:haloacid dehalogenase-like hydrolase domain-containing protein At4g39970 isoform X6 [Andrographis paniculata]|uniref:haloacid dehalogenase-like hydrolase domain-containing protein At4g39970 isoform X6 n=1 Tax=Andrographis paniculata TaxID=175694 RepID=UPI0021E80880|nr:haloacid dehalogenase-like hydrolase domain-containing protein At4g39970 isoform X6 [Andrographis paniculata]